MRPVVTAWLRGWRVVLLAIGLWFAFYIGRLLLTRVPSEYQHFAGLVLFATIGPLVFYGIYTLFFRWPDRS